MTTTVTVSAATINVDGLEITARRIADDSYLLEYGRFSYPVRSYATIQRAAEAFANEINKFVPVENTARQAATTLADYTETKRAEYEGAGR